MILEPSFLFGVTCGFLLAVVILMGIVWLGDVMENWDEQARQRAKAGKTIQ